MQDDREEDSLLLESKPVTLGHAEVFLRPLRFMFGVETNIAAVAHENTSTTSDPRPRDKETADEALGHVHVHLTIATRPPLIERQQPNGFLRAERASGQATGEFDDNSHGSNTQSQLTPRGGANEEDEELQSLRGSFVWLLVRMQPTQEAQPRRQLRNARVQYQLTPATESYLLPIEHTNVIKLLVTDELLDQIDTKTLEFTFISPAPLVTTHVAAPLSPTAAAAPPSTATQSEAKNYDNTEFKSYTENDAKELERARLVSQEHEAKAAAAMAASQQAAQALEQERARFKLRDLELQHEKSALDAQHEHERELLRQELQRREEQNKQLAQLTAQLESQLQGKEEFMGELQQSTRKTDQAIELLKQRMAGDAKEREELQRRLRALEDEKLALLKKSRACALQ